MDSASSLHTLLLLLLAPPLLGALFHGLAGRLAPRRLVEAVACAGVFISLLAAAAAFFLVSREQSTVTLFHWFSAAGFSASMTCHFGALARVMALMVTFVSCIIHLYSVSFMREETDYARYFFFLNLFVLAMLVITVADNLVFLFLGWEGVGLCSYGLISFWYKDSGRAAAGYKAFLLTRIGDVAFGIAVALFFAAGQTLSISSINAQAATLTPGLAALLGFLLLWAAVGKSAQLPLAVWLPDAMAGPTPVSALIHAATMVTAGVYLLIRFFPIIVMSSSVMTAIACLGAVTALYGACSALVQRDIKRILAYSTISQVGYMFLAVGAGDLAGSMFHLLSHAFFKSLLFLAAGCIIQALHQEHDIFRMGGALRRRLPEVFWLFLAGGLALGALPPTAGFFSKGEILIAAYGHPAGVYKLFWALGTVAAFLTTFYTFRLIFLVFAGEPATPGAYEEMRPLPRLMTRLLWPLALLCLAGGLLDLPGIMLGGEWLSHYLGAVPGAERAPEVSMAAQWGISLLDMAAGIAGLVAAYLLYGPQPVWNWRRPVVFPQTMHDILFSGLGLDRIYESLVARPYRVLANALWKGVDEAVIDRGVAGWANTFPASALVLRGWTSGRLSTYLAMIFLGVAVILAAAAAVFSGL
ncbi:MAG: NADH-quinone oxidoreductase subunit L [Desulfohalobiaceae bacterium]|nr:NADH-quinone oxidoreductase subunit L [Desulfohalobiaceae bacterium]